MSSSFIDLKSLGAYQNSNAQTRKCACTKKILDCLMSANFEKLHGAWTHSQSNIILPPFIKIDTFTKKFMHFCIYVFTKITDDNINVQKHKKNIFLGVPAYKKIITNLE